MFQEKGLDAYSNIFVDLKVCGFSKVLAMIE